MGNGSSLDSSKTIYLSIAGKTEKIVLSRLCGSRDIHDLIAQAAGVSRYSEITLRDSDGALIPISPSMAKNLPSFKQFDSVADMGSSNKQTKDDKVILKVKHRSPYEVTTTTPSLANAGDGEAFKQVLSQVTEQFTQVFKVDEMKLDLTNRINVLERRLELEGLKAVEIEKCRRDISDIKYQILNSQKKVIDFNNMSALSDERKISLKRDVPLYPKYTLSQETVNYLKQPTFDIWDWEPNEMLSLLEHMYHELGLVTEFNINPITLKRWLLCVQENYRNNPFHNFRHCFCVTQMMYGMIHLCKLWEKMSREDLGVLLTSCICHDLDHPGYNNTYQINARTELAIRYNDISPLENHHCAVAFKILSNPECNIFANTDKEVYKRIRAAMTLLILASDMARHGEIMDCFKAKIELGFDYQDKEYLETEMLVLILATDMAKHKDIVEKLRSLIPNFEYNDSDNVQALKMVLIKCCDISNEVRPMEVSDPWVDCLLEEYFNQSDREKMEGLPVAPFMDREKVTKPTAQIGFIKFVLIPMFETVAQLFPIIDKTMVEPLRIARDRYEHMKETSVPNTSAKKDE